MNMCGLLMEWNWQGKLEVVGEKLVPVLLFPLKLAHGLPGIEPEVFAVSHTAELEWPNIA